MPLSVSDQKCCGRRGVVGWANANGILTELVVDVLEAARWQSQPATGDHCSHTARGSDVGLARETTTSPGTLILGVLSISSPTGFGTGWCGPRRWTGPDDAGRSPRASAAGESAVDDENLAGDEAGIV